MTPATLPSPTRTLVTETRLRLRSLPLLFALAAAGCRFQDPQPVTPQRPTLSSDASTTAPGTVEIEVGGDIEPDGAFIVPATVKYGAGEATEVYGSWLTWQRRDEAGGTEEGIGDLLFGARHRFVDSDGGSPALGLQASVKVPVADEDRGLSNGEVDVFFAGMATWSGAGLGGNLYYEIGLLGDPDGSGVEVSQLPSISGSASLGSGFSLFGEAAGVFVPERDAESGIGTLGFAWSLHPSVVFDAGVRGGIGDDVPDLVFFVGMTWNLGRPSVR